MGIMRSGMGSTCILGMGGEHLGDGLYTHVKGVCSGGRVGCTLVKGVGCGLGGVQLGKRG